MALPSSGQLSIADIRNEQVNVGGLPSTYSLRTLSSNAGFSTPDAVSEFYGWSALPYYRYSTPNVLFDFNAGSSYYGTASSVVPSIGGGTDGVFTEGTGGGTPVNKTGYTVGPPGYFTFQTSPEYSIRTNTTRTAMIGRGAYSIVIWYYHFGWDTVFPGIDCFNGNFQWVITNASSNIRMWHRRGSDYAQITFASVTPYVLNTWYMVNIRYNGTTMNMDFYKAGTRYNATVASSTYSFVDNGDNMQVPLRYNNFLYGRIGYFASYSSDIGTTGGDAIYAATRGRYGV